MRTAFISFHFILIPFTNAIYSLAYFSTQLLKRHNNSNAQFVIINIFNFSMAPNPQLDQSKVLTNIFGRTIISSAFLL